MKKQPEEMQKCVIYARVSTKNEGQAESCENQVRLCEEMVKCYDNLQIAERFIDDGISGATDHRPQYQAMLDRIRMGDIRYIVAKSDDRISRSREIYARLENLCREYNVKMIFAANGMIYDPADMGQTVLQGVLAVMSEQYVFNQSSKGRIAHQQKCTNKKLDATDVKYGYRWNKAKKAMEIDEEEAVYVKKIFDWFVFGGLGVNEISRKLAAEGVVGKRSGKPLTASWITARVKDEAYKGIFYINKRGSTLSIGSNTKKKRFERPKDEWVAVDGPAIISAELFDLAQEVRKERQHVYDKTDVGEDRQARFRGTHLFSGKVFCGACGTQYHFRYADRNKTIGEYKDYFSKTPKALSSECDNKEYNRIRESTLIDLCRQSINVFLRDYDTCIDTVVDIVREAKHKAALDDTAMKRCEKQLEKLKKEQKKNLTAYRDTPNPAMKEAFLEMYKENEEKKAALEEELEQLKQQSQKLDDEEKEIQKIREQVQEMKQVKEIDQDVVQSFIERIVINKDGTVWIILKFGTSYWSVLNMEPNGAAEGSDLFCTNLKIIKNLAELQEYAGAMGEGRCSDGT